MKQKKTQRSRQCIYFFWKLLQVMHTISSSPININPEPMLVRFGTYFWIFNEKMESTTFIVSIGNLQNWNLTFIIWSYGHLILRTEATFKLFNDNRLMEEDYILSDLLSQINPYHFLDHGNYTQNFERFTQMFRSHKSWPNTGLGLGQT